jgi:hypothetical protein
MNTAALTEPTNDERRTTNDQIGEVEKATGESPTTDHQPPTTRLLMCAPTKYALKYEINPWMALANQPDLELAARQWEVLYRTLTEEVGARVELIEQHPDCPDMVFTANAGLLRGQYVALANFRHPQRQAEEPHFRAWFEQQGYRVQMLPVGCKFEGEGDALFVGDTLLAGYPLVSPRYLPLCADTDDRGLLSGRIRPLRARRHREQFRDD